MTVYRCIITYDGSNFAGWQVQPGQRTVQGEINTVLRQILQVETQVTGAGRTDTGVHAMGMHGHFELDSDKKPDIPALERSLNSLLPRDIHIRDLQQADDDFHARFTACRRSYQYRISTAPRVIGRQYWWIAPWRLDVERMQRGADFLPGKRDFSVFASGLEPDISPICDVQKAVWSETDGGIFFDIQADRFLRKMVRGIVGTLADVGRGRMEPEAVGEILETGDHARIGGLAPPQGLFLMDVGYNHK